ncbi:unnamed protein product [Somion occarium]|uniref:Uncharacterized protein n=1 Tax=Somion occarium TaxID=3059160 RepID=A0ABP1CNT0_9APHY
MLAEQTKSNESRYIVRPTLPTRCEGQDALLYPPTDTLVLSFTMHGAWVLPTSIDIQRYMAALSNTLSIFAPVAGRLCKKPDTEKGKGDIFLKLNNAGVPVSVVNDYHTERFPMETVLVSPEDFEPWIDPIPFTDVIDHDEPLVRIRFTKLHKTGQMIYTICWLHALGDGYIGNLFTTYIAHFYRGANISNLPIPSYTKVFLPPPPADPAIAEKFLPLMKHLRDAKSPEELIPLILQSEERTTPVHISFTSAQIQTLTKRATAGVPGSAVAKLSRVDVLVAYLILQHNQVVSELHPDQELIDTVVNTIDYRGNPAFAPPVMFGNAAITLTCPSFSLPSLPPNAGPRDHELHFDRCLAAIALSIRAGTLQARNPEFLGTYLSFHNALCRKCYQEGLYQNLLPASDREITFNSSHLVDWRKGGDLFDPDSEFAGIRYIQFHSSALFERYIRVFRTNPAYIVADDGTGGYWDMSLNDGLEAAFRLDSSIAERFVARTKEDTKRGFSRVFSNL